MRVTKIKMYSHATATNSLTEIDEIYITGCDNPGYFKKAVLYDYLLKNPGSIEVNISPYPKLVPKISSKNHEKYVASTPDYTRKDNLLNLPRE